MSTVQEDEKVIQPIPQPPLETTSGKKPITDAQRTARRNNATKARATKKAKREAMKKEKMSKSKPDALPVQHEDVSIEQQLERILHAQSSEHVNRTEHDEVLETKVPSTQEEGEGSVGASVGSVGGELGLAAVQNAIGEALQNSEFMTGMTQASDSIASSIEQFVAQMKQLQQVVENIPTPQVQQVLPDPVVDVAPDPTNVFDSMKRKASVRDHIFDRKKVKKRNIFEGFENVYY